jgi:hypothetical protein
MPMPAVLDSMRMPSYKHSGGFPMSNVQEGSQEQAQGGHDIQFIPTQHPPAPLQLPSAETDTDRDFENVCLF